VWVAAVDWTSGRIIKDRSVWRLLFTASRYATFAFLESHGNKIAPLVSRLSSQDDYPEKGAQQQMVPWQGMDCSEAWSRWRRMHCKFPHTSGP